jgi:hypothetical protein
VKRPWSFVSLTGIFALLAYLSLFAGSLNHIADDPGIGWHLQDGKQISESGAIPHVDPFLARAKIENRYAPVGEGREWISDQWLSDLVFHKLFVWGSWPALYALVAGLFVLAYFGIAADGARREGQGAILVLLAVVCAFKMGQVHMIVRPVIFSLVLFPLVLQRAVALTRTVSVSWERLRREMYLLIPLFALWANLHPAFVYGLLVIAICATTKALYDLRAGFRVALLFMACGASTLANPYGIALHRSIVQLGGSEYLRSMTTEWYPVDLSSPEGVLLLALGGLPLIALLVSREARRHTGIFEIVVAYIFFAQALWAVRVVPFASFACLPLWAACFGSLRIVPHVACAALTSRVLSRVSERERRLVAPGFIASCVLGVLGASVIVSVPERVLPRELGSPYERELRNIFEQPDTREASGVILASLNWGGGITHALGERFKPMLDDRTVLVGEALYRAYGESLSDPRVFDELVRVFGVTHTILPQGTSLEGYLATRADWKQSYADRKIVVFASLR